MRQTLSKIFLRRLGNLILIKESLLTENTKLNYLLTSAPDSQSDIEKRSKILLTRAEAIAVFPTPVDQIIAAANLKEIHDVEKAKDFFLKSLSKEMRSSFLSGWNKLRGFADLKTKAIYVKPEDVKIREVWPKLHEIGHQILPWQAEATKYLEDNKTLSLECEEEFEIEANACAAELLFQGAVFKEVSNSYRPEFNTIFSMADKFGASIHSTARRFASDSQEPAALLCYYRSKHSFDNDGNAYFILGKAHSASQKFIQKYPEILVPKRLSPNHPWVKSYNVGVQIADTINLDTGYGNEEDFLWESWWNQYNLLVLIRRVPALKIF